MSLDEDILHTKNISDALKTYAQKHGMAYKKLDFTLLGVQSYFKTCHHDTFVKFHKQYQKEYKTATKIIKDNARFIQIYKIKIHLKKESSLKLVYRLELGEFNTYPMLVLSPESQLPLNEYNELDFLKLIYSELNKIKAYEGLLINIFSSCMVNDLKVFVKKLYAHGFSQDESLLLFEGIDPNISEPSRIINHYKKKDPRKKVAEVDQSELIITYIKPIYGEAGLNACGKRISHGSTNNNAKIEYQIDTSSIEVKESPIDLKYYSKKRGFVSINKNTLSISNQIIIKDIKRSEGKLTQKEENEVSIVISQTDVTRDGLGEGVELKSESIHITGHMGAKSNIEAKEVIIDGATHKSAFVTAKCAKINRHKGILRCHKAEINSLEGGTIYATNVTVNTALGGTICAEHVSIKSLKHNLKVFASKSITVERILGEDNHFIIDYRKLPTLQSKLQFLEEELEQIKYSYEESLKHSQDKTAQLKKDLDAKKQEISEIKESSFDAVITIMSPIDGLNIIEFALVQKQSSLIYRTKEVKAFEPFSLRKSENKITLDPVNLSIEV